MSVEGSETKLEPILPRFFWRRLFAAFVDLFLVTILFTLFVAMIQPLVSTRLIAPSALNFSYCEVVTESQRMLPVVRLMRLQANETLLISRCKISTMGVLQYTMLKVGAAKVERGQTYSRVISYAVNDDNEFIATFNTSPFLWFIAPALFASFASRFFQTPGKKMFSISVVPIQDQKSRFGRLLQREYLRFFGFVLFDIFSIFEIVFWDYSGTPEEMVKSLENMQANPGSILLSLLVPILILSPYVKSLIRWSGQMFYDKMTGFEVKKVVN